MYKWRQATGIWRQESAVRRVSRVVLRFKPATRRGISWNQLSISPPSGGLGGKKPGRAYAPSSRCAIAPSSRCAIAPLRHCAIAPLCLIIGPCHRRWYNYNKISLILIIIIQSVNTILKDRCDSDNLN
jgi:hypothetical protein